MYFPSLLQFFGISGILFCVCLSSPPVHELVGWLGLAGQLPHPSLCVLQWKQHPVPGSWGSLARGKEQLKHHGLAVSLQRCKCLHEAEKGRQELPVTMMCLALHRNWGPVGKGKRRDSSIFPWLAKGVQLYWDSFTTKRCCILHIFMCAQQNTSHLLGKSPQDITSPYITVATTAVASWNGPGRGSHHWYWSICTV